MSYVLEWPAQLLDGHVLLRHRVVRRAVGEEREEIFVPERKIVMNILTVSKFTKLLKTIS